MDMESMIRDAYESGLDAQSLLADGDESVELTPDDYLPRAQESLAERKCLIRDVSDSGGWAWVLRTHDLVALTCNEDIRQAFFDELHTRGVTSIDASFASLVETIRFLDGRVTQAEVLSCVNEMASALSSMPSIKELRLHIAGDKESLIPLFPCLIEPLRQIKNLYLFYRGDGKAQLQRMWRSLKQHKRLADVRLQGQLFMPDLITASNTLVTLPKLKNFFLLGNSPMIISKAEVPNQIKTLTSLPSIKTVVLANLKIADGKVAHSFCKAIEKANLFSLTLHNVAVPKAKWGAMADAISEAKVEMLLYSSYEIASYEMAISGAHRSKTIDDLCLVNTRYLHGDLLCKMLQQTGVLLDVKTLSAPVETWTARFEGLLCELTKKRLRILNLHFPEGFTGPMVAPTRLVAAAGIGSRYLETVTVTHAEMGEMTDSWCANLKPILKSNTERRPQVPSEPIQIEPPALTTIVDGARMDVDSKPRSKVKKKQTKKPRVPESTDGTRSPFGQVNGSGITRVASSGNVFLPEDCPFLSVDSAAVDKENSPSNTLTVAAAESNDEFSVSKWTDKCRDGADEETNTSTASDPYADMPPLMNVVVETNDDGWVWIPKGGTTAVGGYLYVHPRDGTLHSFFHEMPQYASCALIASTARLEYISSVKGKYAHGTMQIDCSAPMKAISRWAVSDDPVTQVVLSGADIYVLVRGDSKTEEPTWNLFSASCFELFNLSSYLEVLLSDLPRSTHMYPCSTGGVWLDVGGSSDQQDKEHSLLPGIWYMGLDKEQKRVCWFDGAMGTVTRFVAVDDAQHGLWLLHPSDDPGSSTLTFVDRDGNKSETSLGLSFNSVQAMIWAGSGNPGVFLHYKGEDEQWMVGQASLSSTSVTAHCACGRKSRIAGGGSGGLWILKQAERPGTYKLSYMDANKTTFVYLGLVAGPPKHMNEIMLSVL